ncbi:hypothetical protein HK101_002290 [Irineochytrium annulatum]|nr:hypothetical protein HK101_002290 [Irineochytrium annulatum]
MTTTYRLQYWNIRGRGELSRLILTKAGAKWEDEPIERVKWPETKPTTPFGQVPILVEYHDSKEVFRLAQSHAIERYVAKKHGLAGDNDQETAWLDSVMESFFDMFASLWKVRLSNEAEKPKALEEFLALLASTLKFHETILEKNGRNGHYLRNKTTYVDLTALFAVESFSAVDKEGVEKALALAPGFKAVYEKVKSDPVMAAYLTSPNRKSLP